MTHDEALAELIDYLTTNNFLKAEIDVADYAGNLLFSAICAEALDKDPSVEIPRRYTKNGNPVVILVSTPDWEPNKR